MRITFLLIFSFFGASLFGQIVFEKAYYIDNSGKRIEGYIKNKDWKDNPVSFFFKNRLEGEELKKGIEEVQEFSIGSELKFVRATVLIDTTGHGIESLDNKRDPNYINKQLFLKVLIEGQTHLLLYKDYKSENFYVSEDLENFQHLIYKRFKERGNLKSNDHYKQQLWNYYRIKGASTSSLEKVDYQRKDMIKYFTDYHASNDLPFKEWRVVQSKALLNMKLRPGLNITDLKMFGTGGSAELNYSIKTTIRLGLEIERFMSYNKSTWSIIFEPTFQYYVSRPDMQAVFNVDYFSLELPLGIRRHLYIENNKKIFVNTGLIYDVALHGSFLSFSFKPNFNGFFGVGYSANEKYGWELRYYTRRELFSPFETGWNSEYRTLAVIFAYKFYQQKGVTSDKILD